MNLSNISYICIEIEILAGHFWIFQMTSCPTWYKKTLSFFSSFQKCKKKGALEIDFDQKTANIGRFPPGFPMGNLGTPL